MSLEKFKITQSQILNNGVLSAPDKLTGSASDNKAIFDRLVKNIVSACINNLIDVLESSAGAQSIGMEDFYKEQEGLNIYSAVEKMRLKIDENKSEKTVTNLHFKDIEYNKNTGTFKFIRENGEEIIVDTALEKISINFYYDADTESIMIEFLDGTTQSIPLSSFISENEWIESDTIKFNVENHKVSAVIKYGSITTEHLSLSLLDQLIGYVADASDSSARAKTSADDAKASEYSALLSMNASIESATQAELSKESAKGYADSAKNSSENCEGFKNESQAFSLEAKKARDEAVEIAGFDPSGYVKKTDKATIGGEAGIVKLPSDASRGLYVHGSSGELRVYGADSSAIARKNSRYTPICTDQIDYAVKVALTTNADSLTDEEKNAIANWLGFVVLGSYDGSGASTKTLNVEGQPKLIFIAMVGGSDTINECVIVQGQVDVVTYRGSNFNNRAEITWGDNKITLNVGDSNPADGIKSAIVMNREGKTYNYVFVY